MNEQAVKDLYNIFIDVGYNGSEEQFKVLLETNPDALNDGFNVFKEAGYNGTSDDFAVLMGVTPTADTSSQEANPSPPSPPTPPKKKDDMASPLEDGSSEFVDVASAANIVAPEADSRIKPSPTGPPAPPAPPAQESVEYYGNRGEVSQEYLQDEFIDVPGTANIVRPEGVTSKEEGALIQKTLEEDKVSDEEALSKFKQNEVFSFYHFNFCC